MLNLSHLDRLQEGKVLLAFSGGVDSSALFHLLLDHRIAFDIAHVNYHTRASSDAEALSAEKLAHKHSLICHTHSCRLEGANFEHRAREERYRFFGYLMQKYAYRYLVTAHQLNDRLEWLMMQFCRGAGLPELLGIRSVDSREGITIIRPLLEHDRHTIETYLNRHNIPHHIDESNADERYTRNFFRHRYSAPLMRDYRDAIRRSFRYLEEDSESLIENVEFKTIENLYYAPNPRTLRSLMYAIDDVLKSLCHLMTNAERELLKQGGTHVIGRRYVVAIDTDYTFIVPYENEVTMDKGFKEECRELKIAPKLRGYLYGAPRAYALIRQLKGAQAPLLSD